MPSVTRADGEIELTLDQEEVHILTGLLDEMEMLLTADIPRTDAVRARLFPQAYQDPDEQEAYEELTSASLMSAKLNAVRDLRRRLEITPGEPAAITLGDEDSGPFLALLTDLRLAIGTRLGIDSEMMSAEPDPSDPNTPALVILDWLGWIQGSILEEMGY
ncbi:MAG: hypothetical protein QOK47_1029 [Actinomycetota bacterium]|jgi:hypothetical protein|nr:hypothetical protein [Actinomycetota bacterium]